MGAQTTLERPAGGRARIAARTQRRDRWWAGPLGTALVLAAFVVYSAWAALVNANYYVVPYMSPLHRYFFYFAVIFAGVNIYHAITAFRNHEGEWGHMGVGTLVLVANAVLLTAYTISCHSCRRITGGGLNHFSRHPVRYWMWTKVSMLNARHMESAWASLVVVALADLYVRLVASGTIRDITFF